MKPFSIGWMYDEAASSTVPRRPSGIAPVNSRSAASNSGRVSAFQNGVSMNVGATALTRVRGASSKGSAHRRAPRRRRARRGAKDDGSAVRVLEETQTAMRKIVAELFVSLDGVVDMDEQSIEPYFNDEVIAVLQSSQAAADTILLGRRTYEEFAAYWADKTGADDPFADYINRTPKLVVSKTLKAVDWQNTTVLGEGAADDLRALKQAPGKNISITGSATLVRLLWTESLLVDRLMLLVFSIVLGDGRHLFDGWTRQLPLRLVESRALSNGVLALTYEPADDAARENRVAS